MINLKQPSFFISLVLAGGIQLANAQPSTPEEFLLSADAQMKTPSRFPVPVGHETGFRLSIDYPNVLTVATSPWDAINFRTDPEEYLKTIQAYVLEGNTEVDWQIQNNAVRTWYHAPWMHFGSRGREPVHGLTRERSSRAQELHELQTDRTSNWAVGFYNPPGGFTLGQVWADPARPATEEVRFPVGTVAAKLLFTNAKVEQVPYLAGSKEWFAQINRARDPVKMRLLQMDIAVRDSRADDTTGWLFGTFLYHADQPGSTALEKLVPVGLHWGNDQKRTESDFTSGNSLTEGWMNPSVTAMFETLPRKWLGLWGRVNGPVDNSGSACLACHARSMDLGESNQFPPFAPNPNNSAQVENYFKNRKPDEAFFSDFRGLDYSLQLADGVANFREWVRQEHPGHIDNIYNDPEIVRPMSTTDLLSETMPRSLDDLNSLLAKEIYQSPFSREE